MNSVVHFEMPYADSNRVSKFYQSAFGWNTKTLGDDMGRYVVAETTKTGDHGPTTPGAINGGFYAQQAAKEAPHPSVVIAVEDIQQAMRKVKEAGGKVLGEPTDIPGIGRHVAFADTEGNRNSMLQPKGWKPAS